MNFSKPKRQHRIIELMKQSQRLLTHWPQEPTPDEYDWLGRRTETGPDWLGRRPVSKRDWLGRRRSR